MPHPVDRRLLAELERAFAQHAGRDGRIDLAELRAALGLRSEYLARRVLAAFDRDHDGTIDRDEFLEGVRKLVLGPDRDKLLFAFRVHDHDGDGRITPEELLRMITISLGESEVVRATQPPETLARALFWAADKNRDGFITFDELEAVVRTRPELLVKMTRSEAMWITPNEDLLAWLDARDGRDRPSLGARYGWLPAIFVMAWVFASGLLFVHGMVAGAHAAPDPAAQLGKALGRVADLDGALILVPVMRRLLTRVRASVLGRLFPIDDAIDFHRLVGHTLFFVSIAHAAAFVVAFGRGHSAPIYAVAEQLRGATGLALLGVFAVMWVFSLSYFRRSHRFELFYFTHLLYVAWLALAIVHAPSFLFWAGVPILGFGVEQVLRLFRRAPSTSVVALEALRSGVTRLELEKPLGFDYAPGDYVFLRIPAIAKHEWHPFTISSAPEKDTITVHVRSLGNWTAALRAIAERGDHRGLRAFVDGPYGSPSAHIFEAENAVLVGAGIGVTPFASVLESLVLRGTGASKRPSKLKKVHFFWVNRDQYSFEWFRDLLARLEELDTEGMLDIHLCMDGRGAGSTALGVELAREVMHAAGRSDLITGLRTHTHIGPPDWDAMLAEVAKWHPKQRVDVFFCGPPGLARKLRDVCVRHDMRFREERF
jgi:predicted ferric reductase/Ca2+-binding EF-hand superfamily protein